MLSFEKAFQTWHKVKRKLILLISFFSFFAPRFSFATHIMGGEMTYAYYGYDEFTHKYYYTVELHMYRYCDTTNGPTAPLQPSFNLYIYRPSSLTQTDSIPIYDTYQMPKDYEQYITPPGFGFNCNFAPTVCVQMGYYSVFIEVDSSLTGYHLIAATCCRNGNVVNLLNPLDLGQVFYCAIPPTGIENNSPFFSDFPVPFICTSDTVSILNTTYDPDGDVLQYSFTQPYDSVPDNAGIISTSLDTTPLTFPIVPVQYAPGYSLNNPFGANGYAYINPSTGLTKYFIPNQGFYVVAIEIREYRNGVLISKIRRDIQLIAIACPPNVSPVLSNAGESGVTNYSVEEGDTICFPLTFTDADGDSLLLTSSGLVFDPTLFTPAATLPDTSGAAILNDQFCWITQCGYVRPAPYQFAVQVVDNGCPPKAINVVYSIVLTPRTNLLPAPTVALTVAPQDPFCEGTLVTFSSVVTNGGLQPVYQWSINGVNAGGNTASFTTSDLADNDTVNLVVTSSITCIDSAKGSGNYAVDIFITPEAEFTFAPLRADVYTSSFDFTNESVDAVDYYWTFGDSTDSKQENPHHVYTKAGIFPVELTATSIDGCPDSAMDTVIVDEVPVIFIPSAFTPNGDGLNDFFSTEKMGLTSCELSVFNRWGEKVFFTDNSSLKWNGFSKKGKPVAAGIYVYLVNGITVDNKKLSYTGSVSLIR